MRRRRPAVGIFGAEIERAQPVEAICRGGLEIPAEPEKYRQAAGRAPVILAVEGEVFCAKAGWTPRPAATEILPAPNRMDAGLNPATSPLGLPMAPPVALVICRVYSALVMM